ncbi:hypothetical protein AAZX31_11G216700 [Glycine max]
MLSTQSDPVSRRLAAPRFLRLAASLVTPSSIVCRLLILASSQLLSSFPSQLLSWCCRPQSVV